MSTCGSCGGSSLPCGCCEGVQALTPADTHNRPGLPALNYRVGTHGSFLQTMLARLSAIEVDGVAPDGQTPQRLRPLRGLTTRDPADFSIALLDGWASVGDVLSFYQERLANEAFLRTATERRSVLELARLVGYTLRPGVAASVYLAYTLDDNQLDPTTIAAGARSQSLPGPGESPQSFETSEDLLARREWNDLQVRRRRPQNVTLANVMAVDKLVVAGSSVKLKAGDLLLLVFGDGSQTPELRSALRTVQRTESGFADPHTTVWLEPLPLEIAAATGALATLVANTAAAYEQAGSSTQSAIRMARWRLATALMDGRGEPAEWADDIRTVAEGSIDPPVSFQVDAFDAEVTRLLEAIGAVPDDAPADPAVFVEGLLKPRVPQVANSLQLRRDLGSAFEFGADTAPQMLVNFAPVLKDSYYAAWANAAVNGTVPALSGVFALRVSAPLFGASVPRQADYFDNNRVKPVSQWIEWTPDNETADGLFLDQVHAAVTAPGYAVLHRLDGGTPARQLYTLKSAETAQRFAYGVSGKTTHLTLDRDWWNADPTSTTDMGVLRGTLVHTQAEALSLVEETLTGDVSGQSIELGELYEGLTSGRWVILSGERADIPGVSGVRASELMMVSGLSHGYDATLPGDKTHTTLLLATVTAYRYRRETLAIYGNVVKATYGETRQEPLGSGDGAQALQSFTLKQPPLTFVAAPTAAGAQSTLAVYVNELQWHETESLAWLGPQDRGFATQTGDDGKTTLTFGNGEHGARLPTGVQNLRAVYRSGIGAGGNVRAEQISLLTTRPLGVKAVINPLRASGGADREGRDLARENAPLSVMPLDRLVSVRDYADFTRRFAGIAKAVATLGSDGERPLLFLTIAGADDAPIDPASDLYRNLLQALRELGDAELPLRVALRELKALALSAGIRLLPDYPWEPVAAEVRASLLDRFGFGRRALGQPARLSEAIAAIQGVRGVAYVDVDSFTAIPEKKAGEAGVRVLVDQQDISRVIQRAVGGGGDDGDDNGEGGSTQGLPRRRLPPDVSAWPGGLDRGALRPAELVIFSPAVADTLILNQIS
ncbi:MAG TPA: putative baseplate assembly protein [Ideonella sp.]|nr:putative baseplate assembly protein [Ideonella sp.]